MALFDDRQLVFLVIHIGIWTSEDRRHIHLVTFELFAVPLGRCYLGVGGCASGAGRLA